MNDFEKLTLETWTNQFPLLGEAYEAKERFFVFYNCKTRMEGETYLREWKNSLSAQAEKSFQPLLTALHNWHEQILNYFDTPRTTNAYTESLNNLIRLINRSGRGYSFDVIRAKILYSNGVRVAPIPIYNRNFDREGILYRALPVGEVEDYGASVSTLIKQFEKEVG